MTYTVGQTYYNALKDTELNIREINGDIARVAVNQDRRFGQVSKLTFRTVPLADLDILPSKGYELQA